MLEAEMVRREDTSVDVVQSYEDGAGTKWNRAGRSDPQGRASMTDCPPQEQRCWLDKASTPLNPHSTSFRACTLCILRPGRASVPRSRPSYC